MSIPATATAVQAAALVPTWVQWLQLPVTATLVTGIIAILVVFLNRGLQTDRIKADKQIAESRLDLDARLTERRLEADLRLAERKYDLDRELDDWRRKVTFAEEALSDFYRAQTTVSGIRSPAVWGHEYEQRVGREEEEERARARRDSYLPYLERVRVNGEFLDNFHARRFRAIALFGVGADEPFDRLRAVVVQVQVAAQFLLRDDGAAENKELLQHHNQMLHRIWEGSQPVDGRLDAIQLEVAAILAQAEQLFRPVLGRMPVDAGGAGENGDGAA